MILLSIRDTLKEFIKICFINYLMILMRVKKKII